MLSFNYASKEVNIKVVYCGPGLSGKTENLKFICNQWNYNDRGELVFLPTQMDSDVSFDILPLRYGSFGDYRLCFILYSVPGHVFYDNTRKTIIQNADAIVFVADSQAKRLPANEESLAELHYHLKENEIDAETIPMVFQYNKRDLADTLSVDDLNRYLNNRKVPYFEAVAISGKGVMETFYCIANLIDADIQKKVKTGQLDHPSFKKSKIKFADETEDALSLLDGKELSETESLPIDINEVESTLDRAIIPFLRQLSASKIRHDSNTLSKKAMLYEKFGEVAYSSAGKLWMEEKELSKTIQSLAKCNKLKNEIFTLAEHFDVVELVKNIIEEGLLSDVLPELLKLGKSYIDEGKSAKAIKLYQVLPKNQEVCISLSKAYIMEGKLDEESIEVYKQALRYQPDNEDIRKMLEGVM